MLAKLVLFLGLLNISLAEQHDPVFVKDMIGPMPGDDRIVNGMEAEPHSHPYIAYLEIGTTYNCGSSIISENYALTAAHCVNTFTSFRIGAGAHNYNKARSEEHQIIDVEEVIQHENYLLNPFIHDDIAVLKLATPVQFNEKVSTIEIGDPDPEAGSPITLIGWGAMHTSFDGMSDVLNEVDSFIGDRDECNAHFSLPITEDQICQKVFDQQTSCSGDSGSPMLYNGTQVGLVSYGDTSFCFEKEWTVHTHVPNYKEWICENTNGEVC